MRVAVLRGGSVRALLLRAAATMVASASVLVLLFLGLSLRAEYQTWRYLHALNAATIGSSAGRIHFSNLSLQPGILTMRARVRVDVCTILGCDPPATLDLLARNNPWVAVDQRVRIVRADGAATWRTLVDLQGVEPGLFPAAAGGRP